MTMANVVLVACGAALGAPTRWWVDVYVQRRWLSVFPWGTFAVNITGSLLLGFLIAGWSDDSTAVALLGIGFCGSLTTFSSFAWESIASPRTARVAWQQRTSSPLRFCAALPPRLAGGSAHERVAVRGAGGQGSGTGGIERRALLTLNRANPARASDTDDDAASAIAVVVAGVHELGRLVTGSIRCPVTLAHPIAVHTTAGWGRSSLERYAARTAPAGMYQGAEIPVPQPTRTATRTGKGGVMPNGSPGTSSRTAT